MRVTFHPPPPSPLPQGEGEDIVHMSSAVSCSIESAAGLPPGARCRLGRRRGGRGSLLRLPRVHGARSRRCRAFGRSCALRRRPCRAPSSRRTRSAGMSIASDSGRMTVASSSTSCAEPLGISPVSGIRSDARARRRIASIQRWPRASVSGVASRRSIGVSVPGGTFISVRTERTSEIRRTTQSSSTRAAAASVTAIDVGPCGAHQAAGFTVAEAVPELLRDEWHRRMQQTEDGAEDIGRRRAHFGFRKRWLGEFDEPVAEGVPGEAPAGGGVFIEAVGFQRRAGFLDRTVQSRRGSNGSAATSHVRDRMMRRARCRSSRRTVPHSTAW